MIAIHNTFILWVVIFLAACGGECTGRAIAGYCHVSESLIRLAGGIMGAFFIVFILFASRMLYVG